MEWQGHQQSYTLRAGQADRFGHQFANHDVQRAEEGERAGECNGVGIECGVNSKAGRPNRLEYFRKRGLSQRPNGQACERDPQLYAGNDAVQIT